LRKRGAFATGEKIKKGRKVRFRGRGSYTLFALHTVRGKSERKMGVPGKKGKTKLDPSIKVEVHESQQEAGSRGT